MFLVPFVVAGAAAGAADESLAQRRVERVARASWKPVRPAQAEVEEDLPAAPRVEDVELVPMPGPIAGQSVVVGPYDDPFANACDGFGSCNLDGGCDSIADCDSLGGCDSCGGRSGSTTCFRCGPGRRIYVELPCMGWVQVDALAWWQRGMNMPSLVTTSPAGTAQATAGLLGAATTTTLFGATDELLEDAEEGGRIRFGFGIGSSGRWAVGAELLGINQHSESFAANSLGTPILARPFFDVTTGTQNRRLIAFPAVSTGAVGASVSSSLEGAAVHFFRGFCCGETCGRELFGCRRILGFSRIAGVIGWRQLELDESLILSESMTSLTAPTSFQIEDRFLTDTMFNGLDLGFALHGQRGRWTMDVLFKLALGTNHQRVRIGGTTVRDDNGAVTTSDGGVLALASNSGTFERDRFAVIPELGVNFGYQFTERWSLTGGYTFIYWSNVVRPGDQVDLDVNPTLIPASGQAFAGASRPGFSFQETDYWAQGLNLGLRFDW